MIREHTNKLPVTHNPTGDTACLHTKRPSIIRP